MKRAITRKKSIWTLMEALKMECLEARMKINVRKFKVCRVEGC